VSWVSRAHHVRVKPHDSKSANIGTYKLQITHQRGPYAHNESWTHTLAEYDSTPYQLNQPVLATKTGFMWYETESASFYYLYFACLT
jgi:hypothetical protein